jgi:hypothetical protein
MQVVRIPDVQVQRTRPGSHRGTVTPVTVRVTVTAPAGRAVRAAESRVRRSPDVLVGPSDSEFSSVTRTSRAGPGPVPEFRRTDWRPTVSESATRTYLQADAAADRHSQTRMIDATRPLPQGGVTFESRVTVQAAGLARQSGGRRAATPWH